MRDTRPTMNPLEWMVIQKKTLKRVGLIAIGVPLFAGIIYIASTLAMHVISDRKPTPLPQNNGTLQQVIGSVTVKRSADGKIETGTNDMPLYPGDTIMTSANGSAQIRYTDESTFNIRSGSSVLFKADVGKDKGRRIEHNVLNGTLIINSSQDTISVVKLPNTSASVLPNSLITVSTTGPGGKDSLAVNRGGATVTTAKGVEKLGTGERIDISQTEVKRSNLLPAPKTRLPEIAEQLLINDDDRVELAWQTVNKAESYNLVISPVQTFPESSMVVKVDGWSKNRYSWSTPKSGSFYWKVQGITKDGVEGEWCDPTSFNIKFRHKIAKAIPIDVKVQKISNGIFEVRGRTTPHSLVTINQKWQQQTDANGEFLQTITLGRRNATGAIDVKVIDTNGRSNSRRVNL